MKITVPIDISVELQPYQIISYIKMWIYPCLQAGKESWYLSDIVVKDGKLYYEYRMTQDSEWQYKEITLEDKDLYNLCKSAVQLINEYEKYCKKPDSSIIIKEGKVG